MKAYVKPELYFESYELSQHIAACGWDLQQNDINNCAAKGDEENFNNPADVWIFHDPQYNCNCTEPDQYCYTNGTDEFKKVYQS